MKLSLVIDGNYLMQKSVFILYKLRTLYTDLPVILDKDYNTLSNMFYFNKIYFISDSRKNWRKNIYQNYKGTRKKNESIDWNTVYNIFDEFKDNLKNKKKCEVYQIDNLEGDDIISYIVKQNNEKGFSNLIVANDSDLFQLINYDIINKYINFMYNFKFNDETLYLPSFYNNFIDDLDENNNIDNLFENNNDNTDFMVFIKDLTTNKKVKEINSEKELFMKIVGHNKDNIKSIYTKNNRGIGKVGIEKIYNFYKETYPELIDFNSEIFKERLIESVKYCKKIKNNDYNDIMMEKLDMNLKLVKLDKKSMPYNLYKTMENVII